MAYNDIISVTPSRNGRKVEVVYEGFRGQIEKRNERRFLCVGGDRDGQRWAEIELREAGILETEPGYYRFNNAGTSAESRIFAWMKE